MIINIRRLAIGLIFFTLPHLVVSGCDKSNTPPPKVAEAGVATGTAVCDLLEAITSDGVVHSICATAEEIAKIALPLIFAQRGDGGKLGAGMACVSVGGASGTCATSPERALAIEGILKARAAVQLRDSGVQ